MKNYMMELITSSTNMNRFDWTNSISKIKMIRISKSRHRAQKAVFKYEILLLN